MSTDLDGRVGRRGPHVVLDALEDDAVGAGGIAGLGREQGRVAAAEVHVEHGVERERELDGAHEERDEDREHERELDQALTAGGLPAEETPGSTPREDAIHCHLDVLSLGTAG